MKIIEAKYLKAYLICITFPEYSNQIIDFEPFLNHKKHEIFEYYKQLSNFKNFKIEQGNIVWSEDWDLIFPIEQLYNGKILF